jgi:hypothetical protein
MMPRPTGARDRKTKIARERASYKSRDPGESAGGAGFTPAKGDRRFAAGMNPALPK